MNENELRAKANRLICSIKDSKIAYVFQSMLDNAGNVEQILMLLDFFESYQNSTAKPITLFKKAILLGQTDTSLSDTLLFTAIVNDIARIFFKSQKPNQDSLKLDFNNQTILKSRKYIMLKSF